MVLSRGTGLPSAVEGASEVDDVLGWKRGGNGKATGRDFLLGLGPE